MFAEESRILRELKEAEAALEDCLGRAGEPKTENRDAGMTLDFHESLEWLS